MFTTRSPWYVPFEHSLHPESVHIYTGGSKTDNRVRAAIFSNEITVSVPLPYSASIFTAELYAIFFALVNIFSGASSCYTIFSDSKSTPSLVSPVDTSPLCERNTGLAL